MATHRPFFTGFGRSTVKKRIRRIGLLIGGFLCLIIFLTFSLHGWHLGVFPFRNATPNTVRPEVLTPQFGDEKVVTRKSKLFLLPGKENRCHYQYDYICKFWFYVRCYIFAAFPNVKVLSIGSEAVSELQREAKDGDVAILVWRSKRHEMTPDNLHELLSWRQGNENQLESPPKVRIGVFHIANEINRFTWPWYTYPDFVIRNYWIPYMPRHATFVPLGPQFPDVCLPSSTTHSAFSEENRPSCSCHGLTYKPASQRKYLWNFSGSIRKRRGMLLKALRKSPTLSNKGFIQVSKKFGGDSRGGWFGFFQESPKTQYLESIMESQFVFAPCGNAMETHRIYEAIALGAIPVIENCDPEVSNFFPMKELLIDGGVKNMVKFVEDYMDEAEEINELQTRVAAWWRSYSHQVARNVSEIVLTEVPASLKTAP